MTFTERGGWWVVGQMALLGLYGLGLLGTDSVTEGVALGFAQGSAMRSAAARLVGRTKTNRRANDNEGRSFRFIARI